MPVNGMPRQCEEGWHSSRIPKGMPVNEKCEKIKRECEGNARKVGIPVAFHAYETMPWQGDTPGATMSSAGRGRCRSSSSAETTWSNSCRRAKAAAGCDDSPTPPDLTANLVPTIPARHHDANLPWHDTWWVGGHEPVELDLRHRAQRDLGRHPTANPDLPPTNPTWHAMTMVVTWHTGARWS